MRKLEKGEMMMRVGNGVHLDAKAVGVITHLQDLHWN